ncbi:MAG: tRNA epoxyqueuosine(34) reductase QueG [Pseudomonadota bacterium]
MGAIKPQTAKAGLVSDLKAEGFDAVAITAASSSAERIARLRTYVERGRHGSMSWMAETLERRSDPRILWNDARSMIMVAMTYGPDDYDHNVAIAKRSNATISCYAHNRDYHDVIKGKLKQVAGRFAAKTGADVKVFIDTAPLMEKPIAQEAGLGWQGKHTNLVSREFGSWFFLGAIMTDMDLPEDQAEIDHCGNCRACLDACPTNAFPAPYQLDARRCISYLTIEHDGVITEEFRSKMGNRIYGCDDCLAACPWNKFAVQAREVKLQAREDMKSPPLRELLVLDDAAFRSRFSGSPIKRIGRNRFIRNCLIAAGNSADKSLLREIKPLLRDDSEQVRATAVWACMQLMTATEFALLRNEHLRKETSKSVAAEWGYATEVCFA